MNTYSIGIDIGGTNTDIGLVRDVMWRTSANKSNT